MRATSKIRSDSSLEIRQKLFDNYGIVPAVRNSVPYSKYERFSKQMFEAAVLSYKSNDLTQSYIHLKRLLTLVLDRLPRHEGAKPSLILQNEVTISAMELLEDVVRRMDLQEDARLRREMEEAETDLLMNEFDGEGEGEGEGEGNQTPSSSIHASCANLLTDSTITYPPPPPSSLPPLPLSPYLPTRDTSLSFSSPPSLPLSPSDMILSRALQVLKGQKQEDEMEDGEREREREREREKGVIEAPGLSPYPSSSSLSLSPPPFLSSSPSLQSVIPNRHPGVCSTDIQILHLLPLHHFPTPSPHCTRLDLYIRPRSSSSLSLSLSLFLFLKR